MKVLGQVMASCVLLLCGAAHSQVLYQTGFEQPAYVVGPLGVQDGWSPQSAASVQSATKFGGAQALQFDPTVAVGQNAIQHNVSYSSVGNPAKTLIVAANFQVSATGAWTGWEPLSGASATNFLCQIVVSGGNFQLGLQSSSVGSIAVNRGAWQRVQLVFNFVTKTCSAFVDGALLGSGPFPNVSDFALFSLGINFAPGTDRAYWDDIVVSASTLGDNGDGTVTDNSTGLMWDQCPRGLSGVGCATGTATAMNWANAFGEAAAQSTANYKNYSDWRLPSIAELQTLIKAGSAPTIDTTLFPNTPESLFWSSSTYVPNPPGAWGVFFGGGSTNPSLKVGGSFVRLVRGGQYFGSFALVPGGVSGIAATAAALTATSPVGATGYWMVVPRGSLPPKPAQVIAGVSYDAITVVAGSGAMAAKTPKVFAVGALVASTAYDLYLVATETQTQFASQLIGPLQFSTMGPYNAFDVDGNTQVDALTDGLILLRYMFGLRAPALTTGAIGTGATRDATAIEAYIKSVMP